MNILPKEYAEKPRKKLAIIIHKNKGFKKKKTLRNR